MPNVALRRITVAGTEDHSVDSNLCRRCSAHPLARIRFVRARLWAERMPGVFGESEALSMHNITANCCPMFYYTGSKYSAVLGTRKAV